MLPITTSATTTNRKLYDDFLEILANLFQNYIFTVDDASGHYTTGLFYGNNYWTGSLSLCKTIYKNQNEASRVLGKLN